MEWKWNWVSYLSNDYLTTSRFETQRFCQFVNSFLSSAFKNQSLSLTNTNHWLREIYLLFISGSCKSLPVACNGFITSVQMVLDN